jgi:hypothetical protein
MKTICPGKDVINHPEHYTVGGIETIDFIEAKDLNFNLGNAVKYISRCGHKKSRGMTANQKALQDLRKAKYYIEREINTRCKNDG